MSDPDTALELHSKHRSPQPVKQTQKQCVPSSPRRGTLLAPGPWSSHTASPTRQKHAECDSLQRNATNLEVTVREELHVGGPGHVLELGNHVGPRSTPLRQTSGHLRRATRGKERGMRKRATRTSCSSSAWNSNSLSSTHPSAGIASMSRSIRSFARSIRSSWWRRALMAVSSSCCPRQRMRQDPTCLVLT